MAGTYWSRFSGRRVSRRRFLGGGGVAAVGSAALLAGCGANTPKPAPVVTQAPTATEEPSLAATATSKATAAPSATPSPAATLTFDPFAYRRGGTLRLWKTGEDPGLDPGIFHVSNRDVTYSTLTQPLTYQPSMNLFAMDGMVGYEQLDPLTLVWSIRPGMKFHNGDPVDSEAVAFSWGRLPQLNAVLDGTHLRSEGFDFVDSFEPADELTMTEHWSRPKPDALVHRARHYYSFLNPRVVQEQGVLEGTYTAPDGTAEDVYSIQELPFGSGSGPYVLTKRDVTGTRVERWPDYHKHTPADDGFVEDGPYIDAWEARVLPDTVAAKAAFLAGDLDVFSWVDDLELPEVEEAEHVAVVETQNGGYSHLGLNGLKFHDRRARQALQKAIDYEGFIEAIHPLGGRYAAPVSNLLPHFQQLSQEQLREWLRYDPAEARALWEAADFEVPIDSIKILVGGGSPVAWRIGEFVAHSLGGALGLSTELWSTDAYCRSWSGCPPLGGEPDDLEAIAYGTGVRGGTSGIPHDSHLVHWDPRGYGRSAFNHSHMLETVHPEIATGARALTVMLEALEQEFDFDMRVELLTDVQRWILDNAWCVLPLPVSQVQHYGFSTRLRDFAPQDWATPYALRRESMWLLPD